MAETSKKAQENKSLADVTTFIQSALADIERGISFSLSVGRTHEFVEKQIKDLYLFLNYPSFIEIVGSEGIRHYTYLLDHFSFVYRYVLPLSLPPDEPDYTREHEPIYYPNGDIDAELVSQENGKLAKALEEIANRDFDNGVVSSVESMLPLVEQRIGKMLVLFYRHEINKETYEQFLAVLANGVIRNYRLPRKLAVEVDKLIKITIIPGEVMRKRFEELPPLGIQLHQELAAAGAYQQLKNPRSQTLLQTFLKTPKSMHDLTKEPNGLRSIEGVRRNLHTSMRIVHPFLPEGIKRDYPTAEDALQAVITDPMKTEEAKRKMRENERPGWKKEKTRHHTQNAKKKPGEGKREFSDDHTTHLSEGASRRWQRARELAAQAQTATTPDQ